METVRDLNRHTSSAVPTVVVKNPAAQQAIHAGSLRRTLTRVAWLGIGLGVLMELLLLVIQFGAVQDLEPFVAELTGKVTWSLFVCAGLAVGEAVSKDNPFWAGLAGLTTAPLAFILARGVHKTAAEMIGVAAPGTNPWVPVTAGLRGIEYMCLGLLLDLARQASLTACIPLSRHRAHSRPHLWRNHPPHEPNSHLHHGRDALLVRSTS